MHHTSEPTIVGSALQPTRGKGRGGRLRSGVRGFTLVESMMAMMVFVMVALGIYQMMLKSYQYARMTRYRDDARAVLMTYIDQFQRLQTTTEVPVGSSQYYKRWIYQTAPIVSSPTGAGLQWNALSDQNIADYPSLAATPLTVTLGGSTTSIQATVTRTTTNLDKSTGALSDTESDNAAGYMIAATFTINYSFGDRSFSDSLTTVRSVP